MFCACAARRRLQVTQKRAEKSMPKHADRNIPECHRKFCTRPVRLSRDIYSRDILETADICGDVQIFGAAFLISSLTPPAYF